MCGIAGILSLNKICADTIVSMVKSMNKRGPDGSGIWSNPDQTCILGHSRLSIIDLSPKADQPMSILNDRYIITFNGEIYNYKQLKADLEMRGAKFKTSSDTEVILWGWHFYGASYVNKLRGMFAFCLRDGRTNEAYLVRDRIGIKPLLYTIINNSIVFASTIEAILASGRIDKEISQMALYDLLSIGAVAQPRTIIDNVYALRPGSILKIRNDLSFSIESYWDVSDIKVCNSGNSVDFQGVVEETRAQLEEACKQHLVADVPIGSFLSGGVDSTAITALMSKFSSERINSYSIGFESSTNIKNELKEAAEAANYIGTIHHEIVLSGKDIAYDFERFISTIDQPSIDGLNSYWVSKVAQNDVKVALSGLGADEIFAGYDSFLMMKRALEANPKSLDFLLGQLYPFIKNKYTFQAAFNIADFKMRENLLRRLMTKRELKNLLSNKYKGNYNFQYVEDFVSDLNTVPEDIVNKHSKYELKGYLVNIILRDTDAVSMGNSLEVRPVFLDHKLIEYSLSIPGGIKLRNNVTKAILKEATKDLLPLDFFNHKKVGFTFPTHHLINGDLKPIVFDYFSSDLACKYFDSNTLKRLMKHISDPAYTSEIWLLLVIIAWIYQTT